MPVSLRPTTPEALNARIPGTLMEQLGIRFTGVGENFVEGSMPVDHRTHRPGGILHGGASVALAETLGSVGSALTTDTSKFHCVGIDINATHLKQVSEGTVYGRAEAMHLGSRVQVWEIKIRNSENKLVSVSRLTVAILPK